MSRATTSKNEVKLFQTLKQKKQLRNYFKLTHFSDIEHVVKHP